MGTRKTGPPKPATAGRAEGELGSLARQRDTALGQSLAYVAEEGRRMRLYLLDYEAWTSSVDHIRRTPGYEGRDWPRPISLEQNLMDLTIHDQDFVARRGFTYTILSPNDERVIGCRGGWSLRRPPLASSLIW